ncbi:MAG: dTMP kinase [Bacteroidales bacterium]
MRLLVIEGLDGAGKSTQIKLLSDFFKERSVKTKYLHFPRTDSPFFGELVARFLRGEFGTIDEVDPYLVAMLYAGDRKDASQMLSSWLSDGFHVLLDRYSYSNIAYQCAKLTDKVQRDKLKEWIIKLEFEHFSIPKPDLNIFLDVPFVFTEKKLTSGRSGDDRNYLNGAKDIHETSLEFQKRVRDVYLDVASTDDKLQLVNCSSQDGSMLPPEDIFKLVLKLLEEKGII